MKNKLVALAFGTFLLTNPLNSALAGGSLDRRELEPLHDKTLYLELKDYLNDRGSIRREFLVSQRLTRNNQEKTYYVKHFLTEEGPVTEIYDFSQAEIADENGVSAVIDINPFIIFYKGNLFFDFNWDGINGNEIRAETFNSFLKSRRKSGENSEPIKPPVANPDIGELKI